ncbi:MAG TPA: hypothetical protein VGK43_04360 [Solirubrobacterales bacterium]
MKGTKEPESGTKEKKLLPSEALRHPLRVRILEIVNERDIPLCQNGAIDNSRSRPSWRDLGDLAVGACESGHQFRPAFLIDLHSAPSQMAVGQT